MVGVNKHKRANKPILYAASYQDVTRGIKLKKYFPRDKLAIEQRLKWEKKYGEIKRGNPNGFDHVNKKGKI